MGCNSLGPYIYQTTDNQRTHLNLEEGYIVKRPKAKLLLSDYHKKIQQVRNDNIVFEDHQFPPNQGSLGSFNFGNMEWKRIKQIYPLGLFIREGISPYDMIRVQKGQNYFVSALSAISQKPDLINNILGTSARNIPINNNGIYSIRLSQRGVRKEIIVDDKIPVNLNNEPFLIQVHNEEVWPLIIEKGYAKINGSYSNILKGTMVNALTSLCTGPVSVKQIQQKNEDQILEYLLNPQSQQNVTILDTYYDYSLQKYGLQPHCSYTMVTYLDQLKILRFIKQNKQTEVVLKLRNCGNNYQWNGEYSERDLQFWNNISDHDKNSLGYIKNQDGIFFIKWNDVYKHFKQITICQRKQNFSSTYNQFQVSSKHCQFIEADITQDGTYFFSVIQDSHQKLAFIRIIVGKQISNNQFSYVNGIRQKGQSVSLKCQIDQPGRYIIFIKCQWIKTTQKKYVTFSTYSETLPKLANGDRKQYTNFLKSIFMDKCQKLNQNHPSLTSELLPGQRVASLNDCGYGIIYVRTMSRPANVLIKKNTFKEWNLKKDIRNQEQNAKGEVEIQFKPNEKNIIMTSVKDFIEQGKMKDALEFPPENGISITL